jgi:Xaa-Pro aminopeptidase
MDRIKRLQNRIVKNKFGAVLITNPANVRYLCDFVGSNGRLFVTPKRATLITDFRYLASAVRQVPKGVKIYNQKNGLAKLIGRFKKIGIEDEHLTYAMFLDMKKKFKRMRFKPVTGIVEDIRMIKSAEEMIIIRKAVKIANTAFEQFIKTIAVGQSENEMAWNLFCIARGLGAEELSFPIIMGFGGNTAEVHHTSGNRRLKNGEKILIDFGIKYKGYCTDMTRVIYTGKPTKIEYKIYSTVLNANKSAIKSIKIGKPLSEVDKTARDIIKKAGYDKYFGHSTGHGVGLEIHELPSVSEKSTTEIQSGMIITVEPGIYSDRLGGGVRIEDMVYINEKGRVEVLTKDITKEIKVIKI